MTAGNDPESRFENRQSRYLPDAMPVLVLLLLAASSGALTALVARRYPWRRPGETEVQLGRKLGESAAIPEGATRRLGARSATGLALMLALAFVVGAGLV